MDSQELEEQRRRAIGSFLQTRRRALMGSTGTRRRGPGFMRREDVAVRAGVSYEWYTKIEQGRVTASAGVLESIAGALGLDEFETRYLAAVARYRAPPPSPPVDAETQRFIDGQGDGTWPTLLLDWRCDILAWNEAACAVYTDLWLLAPEQRNALVQLLTNPQVRDPLVDWERHAHRGVAQFRAQLNGNLGDPRVNVLIEHLNTVSPEFRIWWEDHMVQGFGDRLREIDHPQVGRLALHQALCLGADDGRVVIIGMPSFGTDTAKKLERLLGMWRDAHPPLALLADAAG